MCSISLDTALFYVMAEALVRNELLCYIKNNFDSTAKTFLNNTVIGFYTMDEISVAKTLFFELAKVAKVDGMPRLNNRKGDNKCMADVEDIMQLFEMYDSRLIDLPLFVAAVKRLSPVDPSAVDVVHAHIRYLFIYFYRNRGV